jgi:hypothetical protein
MPGGGSFDVGRLGVALLCPGLAARRHGRCTPPDRPMCHAHLYRGDHVLRRRIHHRQLPLRPDHWRGHRGGLALLLAPQSGKRTRRQLCGRWKGSPTAPRTGSIDLTRELRSAVQARAARSSASDAMTPRPERAPTTSSGLPSGIRGRTTDRGEQPGAVRAPVGRGCRGDRGQTAGGRTDVGPGPAAPGRGRVWIAWGSGDADAAVVDQDDRVRVPPEDRRATPSGGSGWTSTT